MPRQGFGSEVVVGSRVLLTKGSAVEVVKVHGRVGDRGKGPERAIDADIKDIGGRWVGRIRQHFFLLNKTFIFLEEGDKVETINSEGKVEDPSILITVKCPGRAWDAFQMGAQRDGSCAWHGAEVEVLRRGKGTSLKVTGTREQLESLAKAFQDTFNRRTGVAPSLYNDYWAAGEAAKAINKVLR